MARSDITLNMMLDQATRVLDTSKWVIVDASSEFWIVDPCIEPTKENNWPRFLMASPLGRRPRRSSAITIHRKNKLGVAEASASRPTCAVGFDAAFPPEEDFSSRPDRGTISR
jgi:hypothetical protein